MPMKIERTDAESKGSVTLNAHQNDTVGLWDSPFHEDRQNFTLRDHKGADLLTIYGLTQEQLASLYVEIAHALGKAPEPTIQHLREVYLQLAKLFPMYGPVGELPNFPEEMR